MAIRRDDRESAERKVSSLSDDTLSPLSRTAGGNKWGKDKKERAMPGRRHMSLRGWLVDLLLLLILVGIGWGVGKGYRAVKEIYDPAWENRNVTFGVEIRNIDYDRADQLLPLLDRSGLWYSASTDGDYLGVVEEVRAVPSVTEDGRETMTLYLTVEAKAKYRRGEGYFVGSTRLLAGETGVFRAEGLIAEGTLVSLEDPKEVQS